MHRDAGEDGGNFQSLNSSDVYKTKEYVHRLSRWMQIMQTEAEIQMKNHNLKPYSIKYLQFLCTGEQNS